MLTFSMYWTTRQLLWFGSKYDFKFMLGVKKNDIYFQNFDILRFLAYKLKHQFMPKAQQRDKCMLTLESPCISVLG